jgi:hypothetical protein
MIVQNGHAGLRVIEVESPQPRRQLYRLYTLQAADFIDLLLYLADLWFARFMSEEHLHCVFAFNVVKYAT